MFVDASSFIMSETLSAPLDAPSREARGKVVSLLNGFKAVSSVAAHSKFRDEVNIADHSVFTLCSLLDAFLVCIATFEAPSFSRFNNGDVVTSKRLEFSNADFKVMALSALEGKTRVSASTRDDNV